MDTKIPFESYRVLTVGEHFAHFEVLTQPAYFARNAFGEDSEIQKQRKFIHDAIQEKIEREQGDGGSK